MIIKVGYQDWTLPYRSLSDIHFIYNYNYPHCHVNKRRVRRLRAKLRLGDAWRKR